MKNQKVIKVALAGNPNSGKTSLFNGLVGSHQKVGNWSGVTIEKFEGFIKYKDYKIIFIDLPGTYSLTAYSPEEVVARNYIIEEKPDVVINVLDGTNLERNLYLTTQLMELESDMVIALNMIDEVRKEQTEIDINQLEKLLGAHIIPTNAVNKEGFNSLLEHIVRVYKKDISVAKNKLFFSANIEESLTELERLIGLDNELAEKYPPRWLAIKLLESDQLVYSMIKEKVSWLKIEKQLLNIFYRFEEKNVNNLRMKIAEDRHSFIRGALKETIKFSHINKRTLTDLVDSVVINRIAGLPIFFMIMWLIFQFTFTFGEAPMAWIEAFFELFSSAVVKIIPAGLIQSLIVDGIIAGVGGVLVFLPNILLLFLAISFLEATGYMARAAFVVDKILHKVGLHGKSFIPMITGFGCSVPAFMACRTLKNKADRLTTMMIIPFMSCGAKLPVYILLTGAFFAPEVAGNVVFGVYLFGIFLAVISARLLKTSLFKGESEPFVMELPPYRIPTLRSLLMQMWLKAWLYIKKAGTIILMASVIIWAASNYPYSEQIDNSYAEKIQNIESSLVLEPAAQDNIIALLENERLSRQLEYSFAGRLGKSLEPLIKPLGFDWRIGIALTSGLAAKEIVVSTLGTIYALGEVDESSADLSQSLKNDPNFNRATALALMIFVLLYVPCLAATAVFHKEAGELKWTMIYIGYSMSIAWLMSFLVYRLSLLVL